MSVYGENSGWNNDSFILLNYCTVIASISILVIGFLIDQEHIRSLVVKKNISSTSAITYACIYIFLFSLFLYLLSFSVSLPSFLIILFFLLRLSFSSSSLSLSPSLLLYSLFPLFPLLPCIRSHVSGRANRNPPSDDVV